MGKLLNGINGAFSGKVGPVVGYVWNGIPVMRSVPKSKKTKFSAGELQQQARFSLMNKFLQGIISLLKITFAKEAVGNMGYSKAFSYNIKNAVAGAHPEPGLYIDYSLALISRGDLPMDGSAEAKAEAGDKIRFSWTDISGRGSAAGSDKLFAAAYDEKLNEWIWTRDLATRSSGSCIFDATLLAGRTVQTFIGFISENGKEISNSVYTGAVIL